MLRVVVIVTVLLILNGLILQHAIRVPSGAEAPLQAPVNQGIPLVAIDLRAANQPLTPDEIAQGVLWWNYQRQGLLDQLTEVLRHETLGDGWTNLYLSSTAKGGQTLVVIGNQGRLATIHFAGDGTLLACDTNPDGVLPIVLPSADGGFRTPTSTDVRSIETRLRYLRERSPVAWYESESVVPVATEEVLNVTNSDRMVIETDPVLSQGDAIFSYRTSRCFSKKPGTRTLSEEVEPPLPVANN